MLPVDRLRSGAFGILLESTLSGSAAISFPLIAVGGGEHPGFRRAREIASEHLRHDLELFIAGEQRAQELDSRSTAIPGAAAIGSGLISTIRSDLRSVPRSVPQGSRSAATPVTIAVLGGRSRSGSFSLSGCGPRSAIEKPLLGRGIDIGSIPIPIGADARRRSIGIFEILHRGSENVISPIARLAGRGTRLAGSNRATELMRSTRVRLDGIASVQHDPDFLEIESSLSRGWIVDALLFEQLELAVHHLLIAPAERHRTPDDRIPDPRLLTIRVFIAGDALDGGDRFIEKSLMRSQDIGNRGIGIDGVSRSELSLLGSLLLIINSIDEFLE